MTQYKKIFFLECSNCHFVLHRSIKKAKGKQKQKYILKNIQIKRVHNKTKPKPKNI